MQLKAIIIATAVCLTACGQPQDTPQAVSQSAIDVKSKTQTIAFKRLESPKANVLTAQTAYQQKLEDVFIEGEGRVVRLLRDDNKGSRHQRFILRVGSGLTMLVAHNIDLAERINTIKLGDTVQFRGEYVYNDKGGILHWTHHDPQQKITGGWLKHRNKTYQ